MNVNEMNYVIVVESLIILWELITGLGLGLPWTGPKLIIGPKCIIFIFHISAYIWVGAGQPTPPPPYASV